MLTITFTGDVSFTGSFADPTWRSNSIAPAVREFLRTSDHVVANLEGPLTLAPFLGPGGGVKLKSPPHAIDALRSLGCTIINIANNHTLDCGTEGLAETSELASRNGVLCHGASVDLGKARQPLIISTNGVSLALLAFTASGGHGVTHGRAELVSLFSPRGCRELLGQARASADWVIVQYHGDEEFVPLPSARQIRRMRRIVDWGADIVVCHHDHVVQPFERYKEGLIFYGLGNFIFDIPAHRGYLGTADSLLVKAHLSKKERSFETLQARIDRYRPGTISAEDGPRLPELSLVGYRPKYCRAVYDALYWPLIPRGAAGTADRTALSSQRSPLLRRALSTESWMRHAASLVNPVERDRALAILQYRVHRGLGLWGKRPSEPGK